MYEGLSESSGDAQMTCRRLDQREFSLAREALAPIRTTSQRPNCSGSAYDIGGEKVIGKSKFILITHRC